jgi:hypothetical protein
MITPFPRLSSVHVEGVLSVSKWIKSQVLLDDEEMEALLKELAPLSIFIVSQPVTRDLYTVSSTDFLKKYRDYVVALKRGEVPQEAPLRPYLSSIFTATPEILYAQEVRPQSYLIRALKPVIQLQVHHFFVSDVDGRVHPMVLSDESVTWGIQFSYPQLYQDPKSCDFFKVNESTDFPNTALFMKLIRWLRRESRPTPLSFRGVKTYTPIRLGKKCFSWIHNHPRLVSKGIGVG